jgi:hypothetical protein
VLRNSKQFEEAAAGASSFFWNLPFLARAIFFGF